MPKVLIADDDRVLCRLLGGLLIKWGYQADIVHNGDDALRELLKPDAPQLAILDWLMPGSDGTEVIKKLRLTQRDSYTYVLLLTAKAQREDLLRGFDVGADDYVRKPFDVQELKARLRVGTRLLGLEHGSASTTETAAYRSTHDPVSGLYNRTAIVDVLNGESLRCQRAGQSLSVLIVAIDQFEEIIDKHGHAMGEQLIKQLAPKMSSDLRPHDSVGRLGRDKFLIVAPNCSLNHAVVVAGRLRLAVAKDKVMIAQSGVAVTASIGVSTVKEGSDSSMALRNADVALRRSKTHGNNRVESEVAGDVSGDDQK